MLKIFPSWKKVVWSFVFFIALTRIAYIAVGGEVEKKYYTSTNIDISGAQEIPCNSIVQKFRSGKTRLNKLELILDGIAVDKLGNILVAITSEGELIYQTNISLVNVNNLEWKQVYTNMPIDNNKEYEISLMAQECTQIPNVLLVSRENASPEVIESTSGDVRLEQEVSLKYGYLTEPTLSDKVMSSFMWILFLTICYIILLFFENISGTVCRIIERVCSTGKTEIILIVLQLLCNVVIIKCSGIVFQEPTKIVLYFISVLSVWRIKEKWVVVLGIIDKTWKKSVLVILYFYGAFALVGQRILIYPLNINVTVQGLFVLAIAFFWFIPVINGIIFWFHAISPIWVSANSKRMGMPWFLGIMSVFLLLPAALNLYANNPGISSPDTFTCMVENAHHIWGMYDWHPFFYSLILKIILKVWDSTYAVILIQYFFWLYVMAEGMLYLRRKGLKDSFLLTMSFLLGINAGNFLHLNTIWKDIPYALSIVWVMVILSKLVLDFEEYNGKWYIYLELIVALAGTYFYRKNGVVTFAVAVAAMLAVCYKNMKVLMALAVTVAFIFIVKGPVYTYFQVEDPGRHGMYIGLSQDILGVYYADGEVSEETLQMINVMTNNNNAEYHYLPTSSEQTYDLDVEPSEFICRYLDTFARNPVIMARAIIARQDVMWNVFAGDGAPGRCVNYTGTMDGTGSGGHNWNDYYPVRKYNSFYPSMLEFTTYTAENDWINAVEWRCGVFTLLFLVALFLYVCKKGFHRYLVVLASTIGHILSLLLSTGWSDFRYFWPLNLMNIFFMMLLLVLLQSKEDGREKHNGTGSFQYRLGRKR